MMAAPSCPHCGLLFETKRGLFSKDAATLRDAHALECQDNPANKCFCGKLFPNKKARDHHAATCEANPANHFQCPHCQQDFVTYFGVVGGFFSASGRELRDAHAIGCEKNPANRCFCGQVFPNAVARSTHAVKCEFNPANQFKCNWCAETFVTNCVIDGRAAHDAHIIRCQKNPANKCFCGLVFPNSRARDKHAAKCEMNPCNRFQCAHCQDVFVTKYGVMYNSDGRALRDAHALGCEKNPANKCFCGQLFPNPDARNVHAAKCGMNPANRFACPHCQTVFITKFGMLGKCGSIQRDAHALSCPLNPTNLSCEFCNAVFVNSQGLSKLLCRDVACQRAKHQIVCTKNPRNQFACKQCGMCFSTRYGLVRKVDGRMERDSHQDKCAIPCNYELLSDETFDGWVTLSRLEETEGVQEPGETCDTCRPCLGDFSELGELEEPGEPSKPCIVEPMGGSTSQRMDLQSSTSTSHSLQAECIEQEDVESDSRDGIETDSDSPDVGGDGPIERDLFFDAESFEAEAEDVLDPSTPVTQRRTERACQDMPEVPCVTRPPLQAMSDEFEMEVPIVLTDSESSDDE